MRRVVISNVISTARSTEVNAKLLLQSLPLGDPTYLTAGEAETARVNIEGQVHRPWELWKKLAQDAASPRVD